MLPTLLCWGAAAAAAAAAAGANGGIIADVSVAASTADWTCLRTKLGVDGAIVRAWHSTGTPDTNAPGSLRAAAAAGISDTAVYLFPCAGKRTQAAYSAAAQVNGTVAALRKAGVAALVGTLWLDIETNPSSGCGWSTSDLSSNCAWIQQLVDAGHAAGQHVGIYASHFEWGQVAGAACHLTAPGSLPMWYAHYDHDATTCVDYAKYPFGGWEAPALKQYDDRLPEGCTIGADVSIRCAAPAPPSPVPPPPAPTPAGECQTFVSGLCPGDAGCMCTYGNTCGSTGGSELSPLNFTARVTAAAGRPVGACTGECRRVIHGECAGPNSCMKSSGPC